MAKTAVDSTVSSRRELKSDIKKRNQAAQLLRVSFVNEKLFGKVRLSIGISYPLHFSLSTLTKAANIGTRGPKAEIEILTGYVLLLFIRACF